MLTRHRARLLQTHKWILFNQLNISPFPAEINTEMLFQETAQIGRLWKAKLDEDVFKSLERQADVDECIVFGLIM